MTFKLDPAFVAHYAALPSPLKPLGQVVFARTYSRIKDDGHPETFCDMLVRVTESTFTYLKRRVLQAESEWNEERAQRTAQEFFKRIWCGKFSPAGRGLYNMHIPLIDKRGSIPLYNCSFFSTKDIDENFARPFCDVMDFLFCGTGCGFDVRGKGKVQLSKPILDKEIYVVDDSRGGWVNLVRRVLNSYAQVGTCPVNIDYSKVRPKGSPIVTMGGIAPGFQPLADLVSSIHTVLVPLLDQEITSGAIVDLMNYIGVCVVSGGVRRSAEIAFSNWDDEEFLDLKDPIKNKEALYSHRWSSNNTVFIDGCTDLEPIAQRIASGGEPGCAILTNMQNFGRMSDPADFLDRDVLGTNPCGEVQLEDSEVCNLCHTFPTNHDSLQDYLTTLKMSYIYCKTVSTIPTHNERTNEVVTRNRRIGISQAGVAEMYSKLGIKECKKWWNTGYQFLKCLDQDYSEWLKIPTSKRITTIQPGGSVPLMFGVEGGLKSETSLYYFRTIRISDTSSMVDKLRVAGYRVEPDAYAPNTFCIFFPVKSRGNIFTDQISLWEQMFLFSSVQSHWADLMVSATLGFSKEESGQIARLIECYRDKIKGVSFLPNNQTVYSQAPYIPITAEEYEAAIKNLTPVDFHGNLHETEAEERYCSGGICELPK